MATSSPLFGSTTYLEELYNAYQNDPSSVPQHWQQYFAMMGQEEMAPTTTADGIAAAPVSDKQSRVSQMIQAFRIHGHKRAHINPLTDKPDLDDDLKPIAFGLTTDDLNETFATEGVLPQPRARLADIVDALKKTYCGTVGVQYWDIPNRQERLWLQQRIEQNFNRPQLGAEQKKRLAKGLVTAERFEQFLHKKFVGVKRFSLEGGESLIPMLDVMIERAGEAGVTDIVMGMAHRGRLNVLANILEKPLDAMLSEFAGTVKVEDDASSGDVKYHKGKSFDITTVGGHKLHVSLLANPSHLEIVNPVVEGSARARQQRIGDTNRTRVMPVLMHGDAAFIGQGVVPETLNLSTLEGFTTGGTIHVVINNQVGFTASPDDTCGTEYCTDFARMLQVPIFHVNGDDPEACAHVMQLAVAYRNTFHRDVVIDLVCFRKYGHNEGDDPTFTQPLMYDKIRQHPGVRDLYFNALSGGGIAKAELEKIDDAYQQRLQDAFDKASSDGFKAKKDMFGGHWKDYSRQDTPNVKTAISKALLKKVSETMSTWPQTFTPNSKVAKVMEKRTETLQKGGMDWGAAEMAAYASLLTEGYSVRLTGQDVKRGTFSHRHAVLIDSNTGQEFAPVSQLAAKDVRFEVYSSSLSEEAVLAYEFGYALTDPKTLTIWEAQFGDFVNGAQVVIDQFIASSEMKWDRMAGLVMLLPHGFEGQGPEHSSARLERFLQLCAQDNMTVANLTTPAQIFHALRRQMHRKVRRPLIIMSPKSLLRHPQAVSDTADLTDGAFQTVIGDSSVNAKDVKRVVLCSGKLYYDLLEGREKAKNGKNVALVRVEQLYPLPLDEIKKVLKGYGKVEAVWAQEEPRNQGSWAFMLDNLASEISGLKYVGRPASASPAVGDPKRHAAEQQSIVQQAFTF